MKWLQHLKTINHHKYLVMRYCFRAGLYRQGLLHDMSKYSPVEFLVGAKYFQGNRSPNNAEREDRGYSLAWLHHKGRNKHHLEYWIDYSVNEGAPMSGMRMPVNYVVEMFCDRVAASRIYNKEAYTDRDAYDYFNTSRQHYLIHPETEKLLEKLLVMLMERGEDETFHYIRTKVLKQGYDTIQVKDIKK
ncbi:DUF5662 family protein [Anaerocolumna sp. AGMB13020]|uniref:DUF5662 family protein n=1 Tax=Anaerocolumna sp. AGMB13020 TaxID=3081750 RepID=UPI002954E7A1|nr:DUF5662 family protein [Anaerocolumna sp. AGMB13020]WOO35520.1 DUF5662 family protein [Anaerocolumna sp. AGMB13020]